MREWPKCKICDKELVLSSEENGYICPDCNLLYQLDRGEPIGPLIPMSGEKGEEQEGGKQPAHSQLSQEEFKNFLKYLDAQGPGKEAYKTSGKGVRKGMIDSWVKMGKPVPEERKVK